MLIIQLKMIKYIHKCIYIYLKKGKVEGSKGGRRERGKVYCYKLTQRENIIFNPDSTFLNFLPNLKITQKFNCSCD